MRKLGMASGTLRGSSDSSVPSSVCSGPILQLPGRGGEAGAEALQQPEETRKPGPRECEALPSHHDRSYLRAGELGSSAPGVVGPLFPAIPSTVLLLSALSAGHCPGQEVQQGTRDVKA